MQALVTQGSDHIEIVRERNNILRCRLRGEEKVVACLVMEENGGVTATALAKRHTHRRNGHEK